MPNVPLSLENGASKTKAVHINSPSRSFIDKIPVDNSVRYLKTADGLA